MNFLVSGQGSYTHKDIVSALRKLFDIDSVKELIYVFKDDNMYEDTEYEELLARTIKKLGIDVVITTNFYPVAARVCNDNSIKYLTWSYDTPINVLPCDEMKYETNYIFLFDKSEVKHFKEMGYGRVYHMTLAVNTDKYQQLIPDDRYKNDIAFLGKLYRSKLPIIKDGLSKEMVQYIDGLVALQNNIYDKYVVNDYITDSIISEINRQYEVIGRKIHLNKSQLSYSIAEFVTYTDRITLLQLLGKRHDTHLYTYDIGDTETAFLKDVTIHGPLDYQTQMPVLFKSAKINLNCSLRAAQSAIPLRALDVMGCGAFLLSNSQPELEEWFTDGKDLALFHSYEEALDKADYYLQHDDERKRIAISGFENVKKNFRYDMKLKQMFSIADIAI